MPRANTIVHEIVRFSGLLIGEFENTATALGLGDCSVEITFMPNSDRHNQEFITDFGMMGRNVNLYSHRYTSYVISVNQLL